MIALSVSGVFMHTGNTSQVGGFGQSLEYFFSNGGPVGTTSVINQLY